MKTKNPIVYPISINIYDSNKEITNAIIVQGNTQLFDFITTLSDEVKAKIAYPILVKDSDKIYTVIRNNAQLESLIAITIANYESGRSKELS